MTVKESLDAAWAEAEAAIPEEWFGPLLQREDDDPPSYRATASEVGWLLWDGPDVIGQGPTPAAALRALAAKLGEGRG